MFQRFCSNYVKKFQNFSYAVSQWGSFPSFARKKIYLSNGNTVTIIVYDCHDCRFRTTVTVVEIEIWSEQSQLVK